MILRRNTAPARVLVGANSNARKGRHYVIVCGADASRRVGIQGNIPHPLFEAIKRIDCMRKVVVDI